MSLKSLINDSRFESLPEEEKRTAIFAVEPRAKALKLDEFNTFVSALREPKVKPPVEAVKLPEKTMKEKVGDMASKAWDYLAVPEKLSKEGLTKIAESIPEPEYGKPRTFKPTFGSSGKEVTVQPSVATDVALGTPKAIAETLAEVAPSFVSRGSIVAGGVAKAFPLVSGAINTAGRGVGSTLEKMSGLEHKAPGVLAELTEDPYLFIGKGKEYARSLYKAVSDPSLVRDELKRLTLNRAFVRKALDFADKGSLIPDEALEARKALDSIGEAMPDVARKSIREVFDLIAKKKFEEADKAYSRAIKSEAVRSFFGFNKSGDTSFGREVFSMIKPFVGGFMSPVVQGASAASIGLAKKALSPLSGNAELSSGLASAIKAYNERKSK